MEKNNMIIGLLVILGIFSSFSIIQQDKDIHESEIVFTENAESVVSLEDISIPNSRRGTGFIADTKSGKQVIVTNSHVCEINNKKPVFAVSHREGEILKKYSRFFVKPIKLDSKHDLCIVEVPQDFNLKSINLAKKVAIDSKVTIIGYPIIKLLSSSTGYYRGLNSVSIEYDIDLKSCIGKKFEIKTVSIKQKDEIKKDKEVCIFSATFMFTDALGDHGQSGSPALNKDGEVVGVMSLVSGSVRPFANLVPLNSLKGFLSEN
jgi:S1-C subfamily serine protease